MISVVSKAQEMNSRLADSMKGPRIKKAVRDAFVHTAVEDWVGVVCLLSVKCIQSSEPHVSGTKFHKRMQKIVEAMSVFHL